MKLIMNADEVRRITGLSDTNLIDDEAINSLLETAQEIAKQDVFGYAYQEMPRPNPATGVWFDGDNTRFVSWHYPLADANFDGSISGDDITGFWVDLNANIYDVLITVENEDLGILNITQSDGTALPNTTFRMFISYYYKSPTFSDALFKKAVAYLVGDMAIKRLPEPSKITKGNRSNK